MSGGGRPARPKPPFDAPALLEVLIRHGVRFVLIGGYGAVTHGVELDPPTTVADITPEATSKNLRRLVDALVELDAKLFHDDIAGTEIPSFYADPDQLLDPNNKAVMLVTEHGALDLVMRPDGFADAYSAMSRDAVMLHAVDADGNEGALKVPVASRSHIYLSKKTAGRSKDRKHLPALARAMLREIEAKRERESDVPPEALNRLQSSPPDSPKARGGPGTNNYAIKAPKPKKNAPRRP